MSKNILIIVLFGILVIKSVFAGNEAAVYAVWAHPQGDKKYTTLHYMGKVNGKWSAPVQLPLNKGLHITPVIAKDRKQNIWIVWVEQTENGHILRYAVVQQGETKTGRVDSSEHEQSYAPTILIDKNDVPWIAWSGVTGRLADIYTSRWNGSGWDKKVMAHEANQTPDITPLLGLQKDTVGGTVWVAWFGMNRKEERYVRYRSGWHNETWRVEKKTSPVKGTKQFIAQRTLPATEMRFPQHVGERFTGAFFAGLDYEIQSISDRFTALNHREKNDEQSR